MHRLLLPLLLLAALLGGASDATAQVLSATKDDPAERPDDPGRDIQSISSTYDPAGRWQIAVRLYGAPTTETRALLRVFLGVRAQDGACQGTSPATLMAVWTGPEDNGGKGFVDNAGVDVTKVHDADGKGFTATFDDPRLANRGVCGIVTTTLSHNEPFDSVGSFEFAGAPSEPPPATPTQPGEDTTPPSAHVMVVRDAKAARRGVVRANLLAASEPVSAAVTLRGPGRAVLATRSTPLAPGQMVTLKLRVGDRALRRLKRTGRLAVEVVALLTDGAGNTAAIARRATLRYKRR